MEKKGNVLFVAAHPDDVEYGAGGTAIMLAESYNIHYIVLTSGQRGIKGKSAEEAAPIREAEQRVAADALGVELTLMGCMDGELYAERKLCEEVAEMVAAIRPVATFALWPLTIADHSAAYEVAQKALYRSELYYETQLYLYETSVGGQSNQFKPDIYVNTTDVMERKLELLSLHKSQITEASCERVRLQGRFRGREARVEYAEAFCTVHALVNKRWDRRFECVLLDL